MDLIWPLGPVKGAATRLYAESALAVQSVTSDGAINGLEIEVGSISSIKRGVE
jgi:hypothetical protein